MSVVEVDRFVGSGKTGKSGKSSRSLDEAMASLASLDLMAVKRKVVDDKGWSE